MTAYVALLRAVNVGGRKLVMTDLKAVADKLGFDSARTYIASGNLLFTSAGSASKVKNALEAALTKHMGKPVGVMVRTAKEMAAVAQANPFAGEPGNRVVANFLDEAPPKDAVGQAKNVTDERMALGRKEIYVHYLSGQGQSKLRIPAAIRGTARNMNTVTKLAELAKEMA
jgi:uncharacterized protein (DUF1697 family)